MITSLVVNGKSNTTTEILPQYIEKTPFFQLRGVAPTPGEAIKIMQSQKIDLLFLDIHTPALSGIEFLKIVRSESKIILCTDIKDFVLEGYEHQVIDYLMKPISYDTFLKTAQKILDFYSPLKTNDKQLLGKEEPVDYLFVKTENKGRLIRVPIDDISFIEGLGNYVSINTKNGEKIITYSNLKTLAKILPQRFIRVHKSFLVSMDHIYGIDGNQILLCGDKVPVPIGASFRSFLFEQFQSKIIGGRI